MIELGPLVLGWNLNAGGKVSRMMRGYPDEEIANENRRLREDMVDIEKV